MQIFSRFGLRTAAHAGILKIAGQISYSMLVPDIATFDW